MASTRTVTIAGAGSSSVSTVSPAFVSADLASFTVVGSGTYDVPAFINAGVANGSLSPADVGAAALPPPQGATGYAVDTLAGSSFVEPIGYTAIVDAAAGATTVAANPYAPQSVLLGSDSVTYLAAEPCSPPRRRASCTSSSHKIVFSWQVAQILLFYKLVTTR